MKNWVLQIATILITTGLLVGCSSNDMNETNTNTNVSTNTTGESEEVAENAVRITISLDEEAQFVNEMEVPYEEDETLLEILEKNFFIEQENGEITSIERMKASEEENTAWVLYINDKVSSANAVEYEVQPGDKLIFDLQTDKNAPDTNTQADNTIYRAGDEAPDFTLPQINNNNELETVQLSDYEGKGVMLNFWATWSDPSAEEMPYMQSLYQEYKDKGVEIIAVSLDSTELVVNRFVDRYELTFPTPLDSSGEIRDLYKIGPIPTTYFINPDGEINEVINGALTLERLETYLQEIQPN